MGNRNVNSPASFYGIRPGFNIADLQTSYTSPIQAITNALVPTTSFAINNGFRSISLEAQFSDPTTSCDIIVKDTASPTPNVIASFLGVTMDTCDQMNVGGYENLSLNAAPFTVTVQNIVNATPISVFVKKTS